MLRFGPGLLEWVALFGCPVLRSFPLGIPEFAGVSVVNVLVTGSSELRSLNRRFRDKDQSTDVLSFPPGPCFVNGLAGDIAISADIAKANARQLGHSAAQEIKVLALHGLLHLVGYDHESDQGVMARKERQLRRSLGLPLGLIERSGQTEMLTKKPPAKAAGGGARSTRATRSR